MTEDTNEPYTTLERFVWPVILVIVGFGLFALIELIGILI